MFHYSFPKSSFQGKISEGRLNTWKLKVTLVVSSENVYIPLESQDSPPPHWGTLLSASHIFSSSYDCSRFQEKHSCPETHTDDEDCII